MSPDHNRRLMETRYDELLRSQAIVELTEANLTPADTAPAWDQEVTYLRDDLPDEQTPRPPLVQEIARLLAMEG